MSICPTPPIFRHGRHRFAVVVAALLAALALVVVQPRDAHAAGTYIHQSCVNGADLADAYGGWATSVYPTVGNGDTNMCPSGGLHSEMNPGGAIPLGATVGWTYTAPANTNITRFTASYAGWTKLYDNVNQGLIQVLNGAGTVGLNYNDDSSTDINNPHTIDWNGLNTNSITTRIVCDGPTGHPGCQGSVGWVSFYYPKLYLADDLPPTAGATSGSLTTDATLKGNKGLSYSATDIGGGIARLRIYVDGALTSVDHVIDDNNGHCQVQSVESGTWVFSWPKPCPGAVSADETIDTTTIADGQHTITAKVVDAGQREATLWTGSRLVANHPPVLSGPPAYEVAAVALKPVVGTELVAGQGQWSGPSLTYAFAWQRCDAQGANCAQIPGAATLRYVPSADDIGHRLRLAVTATNAADSITAYSDPTGIVTAPSSAGDTTIKPPADGTNGSNGSDGTNGTGGAGGAGGSGGAAAATPPTLSTQTTTTTVQHTLIGHVAGERDGVACRSDKATLKLQHIKGGQLTLHFGKASTVQAELTCTETGKAIVGAKLEIATKTASHPAVAADMTTDGAGHAVLRIAKGASRGVTVGYRMYADDPIARATATLQVLVDGSVSLKANHGTVHNGQAVTLRGKLAGGEIPKRGVTLAVQWKDGKKWRPFAQIKTTKTGTFAYAYKFTRTNKTVGYQLRVQITKGQVDYPYLAVASKAVKVKVTP